MVSAVPSAHVSIASDVRDWMIAVGTVGAVIAALGITWWSDQKAKRRRPRLSLGFDREKGIVNETVTYQVVVLGWDQSGQPQQQVQPRGTGPAAHLRFAITNARGRDAAEDVEVLLSRITEPSFTGETRTVDISFPPFGWTHLDASRLTIPAGVTRSVDIARVHGEPPDAALADVLELLVRPEPGDHRNRLAPGTYELHLTVSARNADAVEYVTRVGLYESPNADDPAARVTVIDPPHVASARVLR